VPPSDLEVIKKIPASATPTDFAHVACIDTPELSVRPRWQMDEQVGTPLPIAPAVARASRHALAQIARRAVPALGDFAVVFVVARRSLVGIASAHVNPDGDRLLRALQRIYRVGLADRHSTAAQVIRTRRPAIRHAIHHERSGAARRGSIADLHQRLGSRSALVLPIVGDNCVLGALSLCYAESGRTYSRGDIPAAQRLARALAHAIAADFAHAASRLYPPARDARRKPAARRRVAPRN
jgi:GAF domain-containing protein